MQDQYVGDVGDFGKYGLLRVLCGSNPAADPRFRLGVVWYWLPADPKVGRRHFGYLDPRNRRAGELQRCDPDLYETLREIHDSGPQDVATVRRRRVLPSGTVYFDEPVPGDDRPRDAWAGRALEKTEPCDLVFLDPDNGIASPAKRSRNRLSKYVLLDEVDPFVRRGQSVVIYHHLGRRKDALSQISDQLERLHGKPGSARPFGLWYHRGTARAFLVIPAPDHGRILRGRTDHLLAGPWGEGRPPPHFTCVPGAARPMGVASLGDAERT